MSQRVTLSTKIFLFFINIYNFEQAYHLPIDRKFPQIIPRRGVPLSSTPPSVQHISSTQKGLSFSAHKSLSSTPKTPQFNTNPSVPHPKPLSSTQTPQFHTKNPSVPPPLSSTPKTPQFHPPQKRSELINHSKTSQKDWT